MSGKTTFRTKKYNEITLDVLFRLIFLESFFFFRFSLRYPIENDFVQTFYRRVYYLHGAHRSSETKQIIQVIDKRTDENGPKIKRSIDSQIVIPDSPGQCVFSSRYKRSVLLRRPKLIEFSGFISFSIIRY